MAFPDKDLDSTELGGEVSWTAPGVVSDVTAYDVYLAEDAAGANKATVGSEAYDVYLMFVWAEDAAELPVDTLMLPLADDLGTVRPLPLQMAPATVRPSNFERYPTKR